MSSLFNHVFIPLVILLLLSERLGLDKKKVLVLSFVAILPDIDAVFLPHRAAFHNLFILIIPLFLFLLIKSRREVFGIVSFYLISHLVLDLFNGGIFLMYPVYDGVFYANFEIRYMMGSLIPVLDHGISNRIMNNGIGEPVISSENIGIIFLLILIALIFIIINRKNKV